MSYSQLHRALGDLVIGGIVIPTASGSGYVEHCRRALVAMAYVVTQ